MRWIFRQVDEPAATRLAAELAIEPVLARLLIQRGIATAEQAHRFLNPGFEHLHAPERLKGLAIALERLHAAIERKEKLLIYGDYDVDGTVAIVILKAAIEICGGGAEFHVPHRIRDGYGMKDEVIEAAAEAGVRLVISVDTGIRAYAAAEAAARAGVDLIVTDHHLPEADEQLPRAFAVLNPNQPGCDYPCKMICGAAVAFKLAQALITRVRGEQEMRRLLPSFMKMVAIATIADAVPLTGENRVFARLGLNELRRPVNAGLKALFTVADIGRRKLTATDVAFRIAPRLNAAGRMDVASEVIELFSCKDAARAKDLAEKLNTLNSGRQQEEERILAGITERVENDAELQRSYLMLVDGDGWHKGVIGIAASRVVERFSRPALVVSRNGGFAQGSGRSIPGFHLLNALESCKELFSKHGGHAAAVGFTVPCDRLEELRARLDAYARRHLSEADFVPSIELDSQVTLKEVTPQLLKHLAQLEPFGMGNREPVFAVTRASLLAPPKTLKEKHVKLRVRQNGGMSFDVLGWRMAGQLLPMCLEPNSLLDLAFTVDENDHPDFGGIQLALKDVRHSDGHGSCGPATPAGRSAAGR